LGRAAQRDGFDRVGLGHGYIFVGLSEDKTGLPVVPCADLAARLRYASARQLSLASRAKVGGRYKDRTCDPFHVKEVLYR
jgi:hypothetical protein